MLLGVAVMALVVVGTGVVVLTGVGGDDENGGSSMNSMNARMISAMIAAIHSLRRDVSGASRAPGGVPVVSAGSGASITRVGGRAGIGGG